MCWALAPLNRSPFMVSFPISFEPFPLPLPLPLPVAVLPDVLLIWISPVIPVLARVVIVSWVVVVSLVGIPLGIEFSAPSWVFPTRIFRISPWSPNGLVVSTVRGVFVGSSSLVSAKRKNKQTLILLLNKYTLSTLFFCYVKEQFSDLFFCVHQGSCTQRFGNESVCSGLNNFINLPNSKCTLWVVS